MVGSEELEPGDGWSYDNFLQPLVADPEGTDAAGLGSLMVEGYRKYYGDRDATTLSAVDLTKTTTLADCVSAIRQRLPAPNLDDHLPVLKQARNACANYAPGYGLNSIDLGRFLDQVANAADVNPALAEKATTARNALHDMVIDNCASTQRQGKFRIRGGSHLLPEDTSGPRQRRRRVRLPAGKHRVPGRNSSTSRSGPNFSAPLPGEGGLISRRRAPPPTVRGALPTALSALVRAQSDSFDRDHIGATSAAVRHAGVGAVAL